MTKKGMRIDTERYDLRDRNAENMKRTGGSF